MGHVVGELAASLVEVLAFGVREERLLVAGPVAVSDGSARLEVGRLSHSMWGEERMELTGMGERMGRFIRVVVVVEVEVESRPQGPYHPPHGLERKETEKTEFPLYYLKQRTKGFDRRGDKERRWLQMVAVEVEVDMPNRAARGSLVSDIKRPSRAESVALQPQPWPSCECSSTK